MTDDALEPEGAAAIPKLSISCSSAEGRAALENLAARLLGKMPIELAERLARTVFLLALDQEKHAGFAQGLGQRDAVTTQLAQEQIRQSAALDEQLTVIVMQLVRPLHLERNALVLAHELGHVACGHTDHAGLVALNAGAAEAIEREAEAFALRYVRGEAASRE